MLQPRRRGDNNMRKHSFLFTSSCAILVEVFEPATAKLCCWCWADICSVCGKCDNVRTNTAEAAALPALFGLSWFSLVWRYIIAPRLIRKLQCLAAVWAEDMTHWCTQSKANREVNVVLVILNASSSKHKNRSSSEFQWRDRYVMLLVRIAQPVWAGVYVQSISGTF